MNKISDKLRFKSGIYLIFNLCNGKKYIGSSVDIYNRLHEHVHNLKNNKSHNQHLQNSWNKYGEDSFQYSVLEYCSPEIRFDKEQYYITVIHPEYNLTENVIANFGHSPNIESRNKISETLKKKYASGEIVTYKQDHAWVPCYLYDILSFKFIKEFKNLADAHTYINISAKSIKQLQGHRIFGKYGIIIKSEFKKSNLTIKDFILKNFYKCLSNSGEYLVTEDSACNLVYHKSITDCAKYVGISRSMIFKHANATKDTPYIPVKSNYKIYYLNNFIPTEGAVYLEESNRSLLGNIGKNPNTDNTEINLKTKEFKSSYSIEDEPEKNIIPPRVSNTPTEISG